MPKWLEDHALSLCFTLLFLIAVTGQGVTGHASYNSDRELFGLPPVGFLQYLRTGTFLDGMFANWQAAILQLGCLILFGKKLREKGAAHSRKPKGDPEAESDHEGDDRSWVYRNSLSLAFFGLFALAFVAHLFFGAMANNERLQLAHKPLVSTGSYAVSSTFWFSNAQTWEAEFAAIAIFVILSIFLRQQGSPESKPVDSSDKQTGDPNK